MPRRNRLRPWMSPSPRKAWIETCLDRESLDVALGRLPPGRRGLKPHQTRLIHNDQSRLPPGRRGLKPRPRRTRAISSGRLPPGRRGLKRAPTWGMRPVPGRLPPGRRGLKRRAGCRDGHHPRRLPPGRRGLKQIRAEKLGECEESPSPRKAWIETVSGM